MANIGTDSENKENINKYVEDILNYSYDSLDLGNTSRFSENPQTNKSIGPALVSADSVESQKQQQSILDNAHISFQTAAGHNSITTDLEEDEELQSPIKGQETQDSISKETSTQLEDSNLINQEKEPVLNKESSCDLQEDIKQIKSEEKLESKQVDYFSHKDQKFDPNLIEDIPPVEQEDFSQEQKSQTKLIDHNPHVDLVDFLPEQKVDTKLIEGTKLSEQEDLLQQQEVKSDFIEESSSIKKEYFDHFSREGEIETKIMEFTKNYSDDLLMGQNDNSQGRSDMPSGGVDLADFELPPYSGSSSGSEARQSNSPVKRKSSTSTTPPQATSSQQQTSVGLRGLKNLLMTTYSKISHVLQWKKPIETGIYFTIGLTLITALTFFSIISVVAYTALGIILTSGSMRVYKSIMQTLNKSPETPFDHVWDKIQNTNVSIFTEKIVEFIDASMVGNLNASLAYLKQVLLFEDKIATLKFGCYFYLLTYIGSWFNGMTLITLTYLAMFTLPIAYEKNKTQIDQYYNLVQGHMCTTTKKVTSMIFGSSKSDSSTSSKKQN